MLRSPFPRSYFVAGGLDNAYKVHCTCCSEGTKLVIVIIAIQLAHSSWLLAYSHLANILSTHTQCSIQSLGDHWGKFSFPVCREKPVTELGVTGQGHVAQYWWDRGEIHSSSVGQVVMWPSHLIQFTSYRERRCPGVHTPKFSLLIPFSPRVSLGGRYSTVLLALWLWTSWLLWLWWLRIISRINHKSPFSSVGLALVPRHGTLGSEATCLLMELMSPSSPVGTEPGTIDRILENTPPIVLWDEPGSPFRAEKCFSEFL